MTTELTYLAATALVTSLMWIPYIINVIATWGMSDAVGYPEDPPAIAKWAQRMKKAHYNAVENLAVFGALVLVANAAGISNDATVWATAVYFWARVVHYFVYAFGIPWLRTAAFGVGAISQLVLAWEILL